MGREVPRTRGLPQQARDGERAAERGRPGAMGGEAEGGEEEGTAGGPRPVAGEF